MYIYTAAVQNYDTTTMIQLLYYTLYLINMINYIYIAINV